MVRLIYLLLLFPTLCFGQGHVRRSWVMELLGDSTAVLRLIIPDSSKVLFQSDTLALLITNTDTIPLHNQIIKMPDSSQVLFMSDTLALVMTNSDSVPLHNQIILKLAISDTSYLHNQIILKLAIADTSYLHNQIILKSNLASPTFTGTVTIPTPFTLDAVSVLPTGTELNFVDGVTSAIQTQIDTRKSRGNCMYPTANSGVLTAGAYMYIDASWIMSSTRGYVMPFAGSIVAIACQTEVTAQTTAGNLNAKALINNSDALQITKAIDGAAIYSWSATAAVGTWTFAAGALLQTQIGFPTFVGSIRRTNIEVVVCFD